MNLIEFKKKKKVHQIVEGRREEILDAGGSKKPILERPAIRWGRLRNYKIKKKKCRKKKGNWKA